MKSDFDQLFDILKIHYKYHQDPEHSAYVYVAQMARSLPADTIKFHLEHLEKKVVIDTLKA